VAIFSNTFCVSTSATVGCFFGPNPTALVKSSNQVLGLISGTSTAFKAMSDDNTVLSASLTTALPISSETTCQSAGLTISDSDLVTTGATGPGSPTVARILAFFIS